MKKVLFVIDSLNCGGAERSLLSLLTVLDSSKYEKHLWILHPGGVLDQLVPNDVIIENPPVYSKYQKNVLQLSKKCFSLRLRWNQNRKQPRHNAEVYWQSCGYATQGLDQAFDIAVAYQQGVPTYIVATKIKATRKIAWINVNIKGAGYNIDYNTPFYKKMDCLVCVSEMLESLVKEEYMPQFKDKIHCVYDIVSPDIVKGLALQSVEELNENLTNRLVLTTVGRMAHQKNYPLAVQTARLLRQRGIDFTWFFVGDGSMLEPIRQQIRDYDLQDNVKALGLRINPYPYINACDIYVQTSLFEGFGLTIAEAKMLGKPIVSTNFDVVHNQLENGVNGIIVEMTPEAMADAICELVNNEDKRNHLTQNLKDSVVNNAVSELKKIDEIFS